MELSLRTTPGSCASQVTLAPGRRESTSYGPTASRAVKRSYSGMAILMTATLHRGQLGVKRNVTTSPSCITYSRPSTRVSAFSRAAV